MNPPTSSSEEALRSGDPRAFGRLYTDLSPRVLGYLRRLTHNASEAEDLTQETFVVAYAGRATYSGGAQPIGWLIGIARRRWRDGIRKLRLTRDELSDEVASADDPEANVVRAELLKSALAQLAPANREALLLVFGEGYTYAEAAETLSQPIGTVKWRVHAASRQMRDLLSAEDQEKLP